MLTASWAPLHDSGEANGFLYYVMPYVEGESLRERLNRGRQPVEAALAIAGAVAGAMDYAHRRGVIHRDLKPENILLHEGQALIADFGIAIAMSAAGAQRLTDTGISLGTPYYMSPEQATGAREIDARSDVYSLGCVLYEMLAGSPPVEGTTAQEVLAAKVVGQIPSVRPHRRELPDRLVRAVEKALALMPADRFSSAHDFGTDLARAAADWTDAGRRRTRRRVAAGVVLLGAIAAAKLYADQLDSMYALGVRVASLIPSDSGFVRSWRTMAFPTTSGMDEKSPGKRRCGPSWMAPDSRGRALGRRGRIPRPRTTTRSGA